MNFYKLSLSLAGLMCSTALVACSGNSRGQEALLQKSSTTAIIGGDVVSSSESIAKSTVALLITVTDQNQQGGQYVCAGTLIRPNVVLTAAHCAPPSDQKHFVRVYVAFTDDFETLDNRDVRLVTDQVLHPGLGRTGPQGEDQNDIALVKFSGPLPSNYRAARLLSGENTLPPNVTMTLAGFGLTDGLAEKSDGRLRKVDVLMGEAFGRTEIIIDQSRGKGACHGDSGGPAFVNIKGTQYLLGVISRGVGLDDCLSQGVVTKVTAHADFIDSALRQLKAR